MACSDSSALPQTPGASDTAPVHRLRSTPEDHRIAWLATLAIAIHVAESALPTPVPGIKPGLANVITLATLLTFGWRTAVWVGLLRVLAGSLLIGTFLSPTFLLSLAGAVATLAVFGLLHAIPGRPFGPVGYSVPAAMAHTAAQFGLAYILFVPHPGLFRLLPPLMTMAVVTGLLSGLIAQRMVRR